MSKRAEELERQARAEFPDLSPSELVLIRAAAEGIWADFRSPALTENNPRKPMRWGLDRTIRADRLGWLCCGPSAQRHLHFAGIKITGAKIAGNLDLASANIPVPLVLAQCAIAEAVILRSARTKYILLDGSSIGSIEADGVQIDGSLFLRNRFRVRGEVRLIGAEIRGDLDCSAAVLASKSGQALIGDRAIIGGGFFLNRAIVVGIARLPGVRLSGNVECRRARLMNPHGTVLNLERSMIGGNVDLSEGLKAHGSVVLDQSSIVGSLVSVGGCLLNSEGVALSANFTKIDGGVFLSGRFHGRVALRKATIGGDLRCDGGQLLNPEGSALDASGINVGGSVQMRSYTGPRSADFIAIGLINLGRASISGDLDCRGANIINPGKCTLLADGAVIKGGAFFNQRFFSSGQVRLIASNLSEVSCDAGIFLVPSGIAVSADRITVAGNFSLSAGSLTQGEIHLNGAEIGGSLLVNRASFLGPGSSGLLAEGAVIKRSFWWMGIRSNPPQSLMLDLGYAAIGQLADEEKSWPAEAANANIEGLTYGAFAVGSAAWRPRLNWVRRQSQTNFRPQPYQQLAEVLRREGHEAESRRVLIAREIDRRRYSNMECLARMWNAILGATIGHGYGTQRVAFWSIGVVLLGWLIFKCGYDEGLMVPRSPSQTAAPTESANTNAPFSPFMYSLDTFLPVVNLLERDSWSPDGTLSCLTPGYVVPCGLLLWVWRWTEILLGWLFTTLGVVGLTGLVRRE